jgi:hypothetical protein
MLADPNLVFAAYTPALIGLAGVAVGGIATGGREFFFLVRRESGEKRSAARLVDADLKHARAVIQYCLGSSRRFTAERAKELELPAWEHGRGVLSTVLTRTGWAIVQDGVEQVNAFRRLLEEQDEKADLGDRAKKAAEDASADIDKARDALEPHLESHESIEKLVARVRRTRHR